MIGIEDIRFPDNKKEIKKMSYEEKMEWYYTRDPQEIIYLGNSKDFQRFWYWNVFLPMKIKRIFYRVKNLEVFKKYKHISEIKNKKKV